MRSDFSLSNDLNGVQKVSSVYLHFTKGKSIRLYLLYLCFISAIFFVEDQTSTTTHI